MNKLLIDRLVLGALQTNCYLLRREGSSAAVVIDPGDDVPALDEAIARLALYPEAVLLTHGHFDHLLGAHHIKEAYGAKVYIDKADAPALTEEKISLRPADAVTPFEPTPPDGFLTEGEHEFAGIRFRVIPSPGHTMGGVCLLAEDDGAGNVFAAGRETPYYDPADGKTKNLVGMDPMDIRKSGIAMSFVPEDRLGMGLVGSMGMIDNMMLKSYGQGHSPIADRRAPRHLAEEIKDSLGVVTPSVTTPVSRLSGGNVQKVLVGREIASAPTVLLTAYAVRGLDINSSYTIYDLINRQKQKGVAVIYVGEDLDVLLELCDRILVLCGGKVSGIVPGRGAKKREVGMMMTKLGGEKADE